MAYRIYLTDDDRFLLDLYAVKFKNAGHEVQAAVVDGDVEGERRPRSDERPLEGGLDLQLGDPGVLAELRKGDASAPDAILLDVIMPGIDGFSTLETIRKEKLAPKAKIIILSNQGQDSDIEKAKSWIVYGSLKWGVMCMSMYQGFRADGSVERAAIGRRSSETEIDLINLIIHGKI